MKLTPKTSAFTLIELLVVISIIGILATLAVPAIQKAMVRGQMTGTLNNARQLQIATQMMALDSAQSGSGLQWTSAMGGEASSLSAYFQALMDNNYLSANDLRKALTAPGVAPAEGATTFSKGSIAFNVYHVDEQSPGDQPFVVTANVEGPGKLGGGAPYGNKGFVLFAKGGSGGIYTRPTDISNTTLFPTVDNSTSGASAAKYYSDFLN